MLGDSPLELCLRHTRAGRAVDGFDLNPDYPNRLPGEWIYGGFAYPHFGHTMSETVHRIILARNRFPGRKILLVGFTDTGPTSSFGDLPGFHQEILTFLDVTPDDIVVIRQNTIIETLHILQQGADLGGSPIPDYLYELTAYSNQRLLRSTAKPTANRLVYVSRSQLPPGGQFLGERHLERQLQDLGFTILHPEQHSFEAQLQTYSSAELLMFAEGSACHGTELLGSNALATCLLLVRRPEVGVSFEKILVPRAQNYSASFDTSQVGTLVAAPDGSLLSHLGVCLFNLSKLRDFLATYCSIQTWTLTDGDYMAAAKCDYLNYLEYYRKQGSLAPAEHVAKVSARFAEILSEV